MRESPTQPPKPAPPNRLDIDVCSLLLGVFFVLGVLQILDIKLPEYQYGHLRAIQIPFPLALTVSAGAAVLLLRTTVVLGRIVAALAFLLLSCHALWIAWSLAGHGPLLRHRAGLLLLAGRATAFLGMALWLAFRARLAWLHRRGC